MPLTPTAGQFGTVAVNTGNTTVDVPAINWDLKIDSKAKDVSNFRDGRKRWPTLTDWSVNLTLVWDSSTNPLLVANGGLTQGLFVNVTLFTDNANTNTKTFVGNAIVSSINPKDGGVEDVIMFDVDLEANGVLTLPTA